MKQSCGIRKALKVDYTNIHQVKISNSLIHLARVDGDVYKTLCGLRVNGEIVSDKPDCHTCKAIYADKKRRGLV